MMTTRVGRGLSNGFGIALIAIFAVACGGRMPTDIGPQGDRLVDCPDSPNCVSSFATDEQHGIAPLEVEGSFDAAWAALGDVIAGMERTETVKTSPGYIHAVQTSALMRYRDDLEFLANAAAGRIDVRSASRVGYGDMGVNRDRVESIRAALAERGVVRGTDAD